MNICFAADDKYIEPCMVSITSLLSSANDQDNLNIHILDGGISNFNKVKILKLKRIKDVKFEFIKINNSDFDECPVTYKNHFRKINYFRLKIPTLFPNIDKIIYLDSDTIILKSLKELFDTNINQHHLAAVEAQTSKINKKRLKMPSKSTYFNSGVLLINCAKWREDNLEPKLFSYIKSAPNHKIINVDQDVINAVLYKTIKPIDQKWNVEYRTDVSPSKSYLNIIKNPNIIHYVSVDKPWNKNTKQDKSFYLKYLKIANNAIKNKGDKLITFFSHSSQLGGAERSMLELILELKEKNIFSHVIIPNIGPLEIELKKNYIPYDIIDLNWWVNEKPTNSDELTIGTLNSLKNLINFLPKLSKINPDLIYSNTIVFPWGAIAANQLNKPHIWHIREYGILDHNFKFSFGYQESIKFIEENSDLILANSKSVSKHIAKFLSKEKIKTVYNYIKIPNNLLKEKINNPYKYRKSLKVIICGNIIQGKNQLEGIKAINNLIKNKKNIELLILGRISDNNYFNRINNFIVSNKIENRIKIIDFVTNPYPYINLSDVILIPSIKEAFGRTAIEGMLLKKVVVTNTSGGTKEIIDNNKTGFLYKLKDIKSLENILLKLTNRELLKKISINSYNSLDCINNKNRYGYKIASLIKKTIRNKKDKDNIFLRTYIEIIAKTINDAESIKILQGENNKLKDDLIKITSSKTYKIWQKFNYYKRKLSNK